MASPFSSIDYAMLKINENIQKSLKILLNAGKLSKASKSIESAKPGL